MRHPPKSVARGDHAESISRTAAAASSFSAKVATSVRRPPPGPEASVVSCALFDPLCAELEQQRSRLVGFAWGTSTRNCDSAVRWAWQATLVAHGV